MDYVIQSVDMETPVETIPVGGDTSKPHKVLNGVVVELTESEISLRKSENEILAKESESAEVKQKLAELDKKLNRFDEFVLGVLQKHFPDDVPHESYIKARGAKNELRKKLSV